MNTRVGGECPIPEDVYTNTGRPVVDVLRDKNPDTRVPQVRDTCCSDFERYEEVPEMAPLDF